MVPPATPRRWSPRFVLALVLVAVAAGGFAIAFRATLALTLHGVAGAANLVEAMTAASWWWRLLVPAIGGLAAGLLARAVARHGGGGVSDVMEAVALGGTRLSIVVTSVKSVASWCAIACGGSIGREGPLIQFGGASGSEVATRAGLDDDDRRVLVAAGTAAGFAAAYNTPFAALAFVVEVIAGVVVVDTVVPTMIAVVIATMMTRAAVGAGPIYGTRMFVVAHTSEMFAFAGVGLCAALVAFGFAHLVAVGEHVFKRIPTPWRQAIGGLGAGAIIVAVPEVSGNGYEPLNALLDGKSPVAMVGLLIIAKAFATTASVGSGSPGGVFTPTLLLGGATGYLCGIGLAAAGFDVGQPGGYALVGMAAAIAAATHAPMMGAVLAFEVSGDYAVVLPLLLATALAAGLARVIGQDSIYVAELRARGSVLASGR